MLITLKCASNIFEGLGKDVIPELNKYALPGKL